MAKQSLAIAHVTPQPWGKPHEVNEFVGGVAREQAAAGHRVLVAAPSPSRTQIRDARRVIRQAEDDEDLLFSAAGLPRAGDDGPPVLAVGQGIALPRGPGPRAAPVPLDVSRTLERLFETAHFDIVHVHDPFAPSTSSTALRFSPALNVGSFHEPTERVLSTQVARPLVEIFFGRLDARTASPRGTVELLERFFPGSYDLVLPGADGAAAGTMAGRGSRGRDGARPVRLAYCLGEERGAMRLFVRALRRLPEGLDWEAAIWLGAPPDGRVIPRAIRDRVRVCGPRDCTPNELIARRDVLAVASGGSHAAPSGRARRSPPGRSPSPPTSPSTTSCSPTATRPALPAGDPVTLAGQLGRLCAERRPAPAARPRAEREARHWSDAAAELDDIYARIVARRHDPRGERRGKRRIERRDLIEVDLHMHTDHSPDCATPVDVLLSTARERGSGRSRSPITTRSPARSRPARWRPGTAAKMIIAEEVKTAEQGEVIGLFLEEKIPRGMTMAETISQIKRQGGLVYVPHPFDRLHSVPDYEHLIESSRTSTSSRSSTRGSPSPRSTRRPSASPPSTGSSPVPARTATSPRASAASGSGCTTSTGPRSSSRRCATRTSSASTGT